MHFVSCRHSTSGRADLRNLATMSMRRRTELIFHVVRENRMRAVSYHGSRHGFPLSTESIERARGSELFVLTRFLPQISLRNLRQLDCYANRDPLRSKPL